ncbi:MAG: BMP family protein [Planctomycetes bacterium]|nr:BMP family protein [Planctomycetota bacterium]MCC7171171.1 BMP family protein [Planctomycetota bacterium]
MLHLSPLKLLAGVAIAALCAACSKAEDSDGRALVALVTPGPVSDGGWNSAAADGLKRVEAELGARVHQVRESSPLQFESTLEQFATRGYRVVFAHGYEFNEPAKRVASRQPNTVFVVTSGNAAATNLASIEIAIEGPSWQAGRVAATLTKFGTIGVVGGQEIPPVKSAFDAFEAGAKSIRPDAKVITTYVGNWDDVTNAHGQAVALLDRGADVLFHDADAAGIGVLHAAAERGVLAIGCNRDQAGVKPETVIGSVVIDIPECFVRLTRAAIAPGFQGSVLRADLASGLVFFKFNDALLARQDPAVRAALTAAATSSPP